MSTNAKLPTCDIKTDHVIPNEAADASSEVEISSDMPVTKNVVKRKQDKPDKGSESNSELFLDQLGLDLTGTIIVMLGRMWDGNMIHCSAKAIVSHNFLRLMEGGIYSVKIFVVKPNKDEYQILKNDAGQSIRVTLWGSLGDVLIEKKPNRLVCAQLFYLQPVSRNKVYLSSTSSTVIYDDDAIPAIKALKKANIVVNHQTSGTSVDLSQPQPRTLENLLIWARNRKNDSITFHYKVAFDGIKTMKGWNFPLCGSDTYNTAQAVVVMFNETATALVNCSTNSLMDTVDESYTYYEYGTFKIFTYWKILSLKGIDDSVGSSNLDDYADNQPQKMKRIVQDPSIVTPSKPVEEKKVKDSKTEDSSDSANAKGKKEVVEPSAKKRKI
nr:hypothetical protein [Tanacetum cinerariifolium]